MAMRPANAVTLDNWLPTEGSLAVRPGWRNWATGLPGRVGGLMNFHDGTRSLVFAASGTGIYDVTGAGAVGAPVVTGFGAVGAQGLQVAAGGGNFLLAFNGRDAEHVFNGTAWAAWAVTSAPHPSWACNFKTRVICGRADTLSFWYGPPASIGGAFTEFPLQGVCGGGGGVAGGIAWTLDGGNGPDDYLALVTSQGELVVFKGTDPSITTAWGLVGKWNIPRPVGLRFLRPFGGDVLILTEGGIFPISVVATSGVDAAIMPVKAYTQAIEPTYLELVRERGGQDGWDLCSMPHRGVWVLNVPWGTGDAQQVAFRATTGACGRWIGIPASCWLSTSGGDFVGHAGAGRVLRWGDDTADDGNSISAECVQAFSQFGAPAALKAFRLAMPVMADAGPAVKLEMALDWVVPPAEAVARGPGAPPIGGDASVAGMRWDQGLWDQGLWAGAGQPVRAWRAVRGIAQAGAIRLRVQASEASPQWFGSHIIFETGGHLR